MTGLTARLTLLGVLASQILSFLPRLRPTLLTSLRSISRRWRGAITRSGSHLLLDRAQPLLQPHQELHTRLTPRVINRLSLRPLHTNHVRRPANQTLLCKAQRTERLLRYKNLQGYYATVRQDTDDEFGVVGERYRTVQNHEAFAFVDQLLGSAIHFETAGSLHGGRRVWVLATLPEHVEVGGDAVRP